LPEYTNLHSASPPANQNGVCQPQRRVVITGLGVVAPNGIGQEAFWNATHNGSSGIKPIQRFSTADIPVRVAGEITDFSLDGVIDRKLAKRTDRVTHFALAAIQEAITDAKLVLQDENPRRVGAVIASTLGGVEYVLNEFAAMALGGPRAMSAYTAIAWLQVANVGQASIRYGIQGYAKTPVNDLAGGLDALGMAAGAIRRGAAEVLITGGCEAMLHPFILLVLARNRHLLTGADPNAYRPFDRRAAGLVIGEGAGICILEEYEHALRRGARMYGEIVGYGQTNDAHALAPAPSDGRQYARALKLALQEGSITPEQVGYFSADGRALLEADQGEAEALRLTFGESLAHVPVSIPRTATGHSYAAAGALDAIAALLALQHGCIPPTINCEALDLRYGLDIVRGEGQPFARPVVLLGGRSTGSANVALALRKIDP
jgi:3-oxoacyl-(acyl-carrier-protein) synthase